MGGFRARAWCIALAIAGSLATIGLRGQTPNVPPVILLGVGLAAVEEGVMHDTPQVPGGALQLRRAALQAALVRASDAGSRYVPGRVIVRFRDETSAGARQLALAAVSRTAVMGARP